LLSEIGRKVDHRGGLPDAALLVGTGDRLAHQAPGRRVLTSVNSTIWRPFSLSRAGVRHVLPILTVVALRTLIGRRRGDRGCGALLVARGTVQVRVTTRSGLRHARDTHASPAALRAALRARLGSTWNSARRDPGFRADRAPDEAGRIAS